MSAVGEFSRNFYKHIAKAFYAVAFVDGKIREEEFFTLREALKKEWLQKRQGKQKVVDTIIQCFEELQNEQKEAVDSFQEFVNYKSLHEELFSHKMRTTIWEVSCTIADAVNKKNKSELILLVHLGKHLGIMK